jgi:hypothetical protein
LARVPDAATPPSTAGPVSSPFPQSAACSFAVTFRSFFTESALIAGSNFFGLSSLSFFFFSFFSLLGFFYKKEMKVFIESLIKKKE